LKPFDFNRFLKSVNKISQRLQSPPRAAGDPTAERTDFIFIKDGTKLIKVELGTIRYIKGLREYVTIFTKDKKIMSLQVLKGLEEMLPTEFIRVHNSYIVALSAIDAIVKNKIQIGQEFIPIGITYKKRFFEELQRYYPGKNLV
jgi:DNA-binding LytR/AlgR family response regulator